jgi:hypothetical protein
VVFSACSGQIKSPRVTNGKPVAAAWWPAAIRLGASLYRVVR